MVEKMADTDKPIPTAITTDNSSASICASDT